MKNIKFNDWQEMALKKDMETIIKKLNRQEFSVFVLCWESVLAFGAIIADHLFDMHNKIWWMAIITLGMMPVIFFVVKNMHEFVSALKRVKSGKYNVKNMVDVFDNQICYWVMMCNSYYNLLSNSTDKNESIFLYQEGCYYNNKSIYALYYMKPVIDKVFSDKKEKIIENNIVAVYRLSSLLEMMNKYQLDLDRCIKDFKDNPVIEGQMAINKEYKKQINQVIENVNEKFDKIIELWK